MHTCMYIDKTSEITWIIYRSLSDRPAAKSSLPIDSRSQPSKMERKDADDPYRQGTGESSAWKRTTRPLTRAERVKIGQVVRLHLKVFLGSLGLLQALGAVGR